MFIDIDVTSNNEPVAPEARSEYLGVYNNNGKGKDEVPFRAAIKLMKNGNPDWTNLGYFKTEEAAALAYNMYAIIFFGSKAILNDIPVRTDALKTEFAEFINAKDKRKKNYAKSVKRFKAITAKGFNFRKHTELEQAA